jgi:predicted site-specific integrase-resolvase
MTAPKRNTLPYPPPWQDTVTLAEHLCVAPSTITNWVAQGILPRNRGGKLMWRWDEVDEMLTIGRDASETLADRISRWNPIRSIVA